MKLTSEQIETLYFFTCKHFVEWYDLQSELVDHLANSIEAAWEADPNLSFEAALQIQFQKFGVFGFTGIIEQRQKFLGKKYQKLIWTYYREFFRLPKIVLTVLGIYGIYSIASLFGRPEYFLFVVLTLVMAFMTIEMYKRRKESEFRYIQTGKKWLFETTAQNFRVLPIFIIQPAFTIISRMINYDEPMSTQGIAISSICITLYALLAYVQLRILPGKILAEIRATYPEENEIAVKV